jgi:integrase
MSVFKNPRQGKRGKKWGINYRDASGKLHQRIVSNDRQVAERELRKVLDEIERGTYIQDGGRITLTEYATTWLKRRKAEVRSSTWKSYRTHVERYIADPTYGLSALRLRTITLSRLLDFKVALWGDGLGIKPKTVNAILTTLGAILEEARREGHLGTNPIRDVRKLPVPHRESDFLRPEEVNKILEVAVSTDWDLYVAVAISIFAGTRRSETLALRFEDFDCRVEYPVVHIRRSYQGRGCFGEPKTARSRRKISLGKFLKRLIVVHRLRRGNPEGSTLIFDRGDGVPMDPDHLSRKRWKRLLRAAGLRESIRWHDMRHTFASLLLSQGDSIKAISSMMGHSSIQVTGDRYAHLMPSTCHDAIDRLEKTVFESAHVDDSLTREAGR